MADQAIDRDDLAKRDEIRDACELSPSSIQPGVVLILFVSDSAATVHGAPISVQLVSRNLHDEDLLAIGSVADACLKT
jgi:Asp-tRNA(Asn)/Glu-tRNA(Gln) amidotransferase A subunit family amidase